MLCLTGFLPPLFLSPLSLFFRLGHAVLYLQILLFPIQPKHYRNALMCFLAIASLLSAYLSFASFSFSLSHPYLSMVSLPAFGHTNPCFRYLPNRSISRDLFYNGSSLELCSPWSNKSSWYNSQSGYQRSAYLLFRASLTTACWVRVRVKRCTILYKVGKIETLQSKKETLEVPVRPFGF